MPGPQTVEFGTISGELLLKSGYLSRAPESGRIFIESFSDMETGAGKETCVGTGAVLLTSVLVESSARAADASKRLIATGKIQFIGFDALFILSYSCANDRHFLLKLFANWREPFINGKTHVGKSDKHYILRSLRLQSPCRQFGGRTAKRSWCSSNFAPVLRGSL